MNIADICQRRVITIGADASLRDAATLMRERHVGALVVIDANEASRVAGVVTDRDLTTAVVAQERDAKATRVGDVMSAEVVTAREADSLLDVLAVMRRRKVRRVPVTGPRGELVGLVTLDDVLGIVAEQMGALAAAVGAANRHEAAAGESIE